jgi:hypothetical protein
LINQLYWDQIPACCETFVGLGIVMIASMFVTMRTGYPEPVTYTIEMTEYAFTPNTIIQSWAAGYDQLG